MSRRALILITSLLALIALAGVISLFASSLKPSENAYATLARVSIANLQPESFAYVPDPAALDHRPADLLLIKRKDGSLSVWRVPVRDGLHVMPDIHWWRPGPVCKRFEPDFGAGTIECKDNDLDAWQRQTYRWRLDGKHETGQVDDMWAVNGEVAGSDFVIQPIQQM
ncbi:hypothetical protein KSF73_06560 [Burkholderiaceae bacterium DAT-1]|nr:hypothetical protein [Burkholderiaceae bacterium DAT-1]